MPLTRLIGQALPARVREPLRRWRHQQRSRALYARYRDATMVPLGSFADTLWLCRTFTLPAGCVIECGVWRGGMIAAMAEVLGPERTYYLFDSFEGLPNPDPVTDGAWAVDRLARAATHPHGRIVAAEAEAAAAMRRAGARTYHLVKGWFASTLPGFTPTAPIAVLRLDADLYDSTRECLAALYPLVAPGGLILIDDYYTTWDGCARAVHEYLAALNPQVRLRQTAGGVAYLVKP